MSTKRKPTVDDLYDRRYRRSNAPESTSFSANENAHLEAMRGAWTVLRKTFEQWVTIGRGLTTLRAKADQIGGRKTFKRLMEQQGIGKLDKAIVSRLLKIMDSLAEVTAWHSTLTESQQVEWASPGAVFKHCPVFKKATPPKEPKHRQDREAEAAKARLAELEASAAAFFDGPPHEIAETILQRMGNDRAWQVMRELDALVLKPKRKARAESAKVNVPTDALVWKVTSADMLGNDGHATSEARAAVGIYTVTPHMAFPSMKFGGYSARHSPFGTTIGGRDLGTGRTAEKAKAIAQADHAAGNDVGPFERPKPDPDQNARIRARMAAARDRGV